MDKYLKCKVCGKSISVDEVAGYDSIDEVYCYECTLPKKPNFIDKLKSILKI